MQVVNVQHGANTAPFSTPTSFSATTTQGGITSVPTHRRSLVLKAANSYDWVEFVIPPLKENQIIVRVEASPVSPLDCLCVSGCGGLVGMGYSAQPFTLGVEGTGVVVAAGSGDAQKFIGKRVSGLSFDGGWWADYNVLRTEEVFLLDELQTTITVEEAAGLAMNPATAMMFLQMAQKKGVRAVVNTASSSVLGRITNRLFMKNGIDVINIVNSREKAEDVHKDGAINILVEGESNFDQDFRELTCRLGVGMIFDAVGGPLLTKLVDLSPYGTRVVVYGLMSEKSETTLNLGSLFARKSIKSALLFRWLAKNSQEEISKMHKEICQNYNTIFRADIIRSFPSTEIKHAFSFYEDHKSNSKGRDGKVILRF